MGFRTTSGKSRQRTIGLPVLILLTLYVIGTSPVELVHSFSHDHKVLVSHTREQEKDPCHRLIYHNDIETGCSHDLHLTASDQCQMCDLAYPVDQIFLSPIDFQSPEFSMIHFDRYKLSLDAYWAVISSSRAPPTLI